LAPIFTSRWRSVVTGTLTCARPWRIPDEQWDTGFDAPVVGHSVKPAESYEFLAAQLASLPRLEMFARKARADWGTWGNETVELDAAVTPAA
jgi:hypothetical protein